MKYLFVIISFIFIALLSLCVLERLNITNFIKKNNSQTDTQDDKSNLIQKINYSSPTQEQIDSGNHNKLQDNTNTTDDSLFSAAITSINYDANSLHIKSIINGVISNNGECKLTLKKDNSSENLEKKVNTYSLPNTSTCKGFDINRSEITNGKWTAIITVNIGDKTTTVIKKFSLE